LDYAEQCGTQVSRVSFKALKLGSHNHQQQPFFTGEQVRQIIENAEEPFKTIFTLAYLTGMRAGEILALQIEDLDFTSKTIRVNKTADDNTRQIRQPKTEASTAFLTMPSALEEMLNNYLEHHGKANPRNYLFPAPRKPDAPRSRDNVVRVGLKPVLRKLGISATNTGLHAFRHTLATNLVGRSVPLTVLRQQMRHKDERTTLRIYAHVIPAQHREVMEQVGNSLNWNQTGTGTEKELQVVA